MAILESVGCFTPMSAYLCASSTCDLSLFLPRWRLVVARPMMRRRGGKWRGMIGKKRCLLNLLDDEHRERANERTWCHNKQYPEAELPACRPRTARRSGRWTTCCVQCTRGSRGSTSTTAPWEIASTASGEGEWSRVVDWMGGTATPPSLYYPPTCVSLPIRFTITHDRAPLS